MAVLDTASSGESQANSADSGASRPAALSPGFGIAARIAGWAGLIITVAVAATAAYLYQGNVAIMIDRQQEQLHASIAVASERVQVRFDAAQRDALFLSRTPAMGAMSAALANPGGDITAATDLVASIMSALLEARPNYIDAAFIDASGRELLRVDRRGGTVGRASAADLQQADDSGSLAAATGLHAGAVYVSDIQLRRQGGAVAQPLQPLSHVATPVFGRNGRLIGVVALSVEVRGLFDIVNRVLGEGSRHFIANHAGDYLSNPVAEKTFGFDRGARFLLQDDYPELASLFSGTTPDLSAQIQRGGVDYLAVGERVTLDASDPTRFLVIVALTSNEVLLQSTHDLRNRTIIFALIMILIGVACAAVLARQIVRPLHSLTAAAVEIGKGGRNVALDDTLARSDETGQLARTIAAMLEQIAEHENKLQAQAEELSRSNQDLAQFAYVASHDLQEPLRMVSSYLELLARRYDGQLDAEAHEFIGFAVDGATRMKRLINDLLGYSRIGNSPLRLSVVQSGDIVATVLSQLGPFIQESGATIEVGQLPRIRVDAGQMSRVFQNLIENAVKYRRLDVKPVVTVSAALRGTEWYFTVADNGIGIDPAFREKIFDIFKRLHGREQYSGNGIGLSVAKLVVERHGGRIWVESRPGGGSAFNFTIPDTLGGQNDGQVDRDIAG